MITHHLGSLGVSLRNLAAVFQSVLSLEHLVKQMIKSIFFFYLELFPSFIQNFTGSQFISGSILRFWSSAFRAVHRQAPVYISEQPFTALPVFNDLHIRFAHSLLVYVHRDLRVVVQTLWNDFSMILPFETPV